MILYGSTRSPFVRKVAIAAHELGVIDRIVHRPSVVSNTTRDVEVAAVNPLGQIPALRLEDGTAIFDSLVICLYLDDLAGGGRLIPHAGAGRWDVLTRHAFGHGMIEAMVKLFGERRRTDPLQPTYVAALTEKLDAAFAAAAEQVRSRPADRFDLGDIALAGALAYADFRLPALDWRAAGLGAFHDEVTQRPSLLATALAGDSPNAMPPA
jgi:glutathione S-transferase